LPGRRIVRCAALRRVAAQNFRRPYQQPVRPKNNNQLLFLIIIKTEYSVIRKIGKKTCVWYQVYLVHEKNSTSLLFHRIRKDLHRYCAV
jgi:hypothetical protein